MALIALLGIPSIPDAAAADQQRDAANAARDDKHHVDAPAPSTAPNRQSAQTQTLGVRPSTQSDLFGGSSADTGASGNADVRSAVAQSFVDSKPAREKAAVPYGTSRGFDKRDANEEFRELFNPTPDTFRGNRSGTFFDSPQRTVPAVKPSARTDR
jgi:hypothetical protein